MDALQQSVVRLYSQIGSIKQVAKRLNVSEQKVRKILINAGLYSTERSREIQKMIDDGVSIDDIAKELGVSRNSVLSYLPYGRGMKDAEYPTINALRIRKCREKKREEKIQ